MKESIKLLLLTIFSVLIWIVSNVFNMQILWFVILGGLGIYYVIKNKNTKKKDIVIGGLFGIISLISNPIMGIFVVPTYLGGMCVFRKYSNKIIIIQTEKKQKLLSIFIAIITGAVLGYINILLSGATINFSFKIQWLFDALRAGIAEEIIFRFFIFAICCTIIKNKKLSVLENILCYLVMIVPHVLLHFNFSSINMGNILVLSLLFGLPFALQQRKRDLTSAMLSHALVDIIRFCALGF